MFMNSRNRIIGMLIAIIFMMVLPSCAFADSASDYSKHHDKDLLKDAASDNDSQNSAMWGDVVLPVQVCAPRVSRTIVSFEPSPFNAHFIALNDNYSITQSYTFIPTGAAKAPHYLFCPRYYYVIALRRILC